MTAVAVQSISDTSTQQQPVPKPDELYYDNLIKEQTDQIEILRTKLADLNDLFTKYTDGRDDFIRQRDMQRAKIDEITARIDVLTKERDTLQEQSAKAQDYGRSLRTQLDSIQRSLGFHNVAEIDKRIAEIQHEMMVSTLSLKEEKKLIADIEKLRRAKPEFAKMSDLQEKAQFNDEVANGVAHRDRLSQIREELNSLRDLRRDESEKLRDLMAERDKQQAPLRQLREERDEIRRKMGEHQGKVAQLQSQRRQKEVEYRAYQAKIRSARLEIERFEQQKQMIESDKKMIETELQNLRDGIYDWKSNLAIQVVHYLKDQVDNYNNALANNDNSDEKSEPPVMEEIETEEGKFKVHHRKKVETYSVGKPKQKNKKPKGHREGTKVVSDKLTHSMSTLRNFSQLGFQNDYPLTIADCAKAIAKLERIVEEQKIRHQGQEDLNRMKREQLQERLAALEKREQDLMEKSPTKK